MNFRMWLQESESLKNENRPRIRVRLALQCSVFWHEKVISGNNNILWSTRILS